MKKGYNKAPELVYKEIIRIVRKDIGPVASLYNFSTVQKLPKTRSGKVLRRTIRKILDGEKFKVPPTIEDASVIDDFLKLSK